MRERLLAPDSNPSELVTALRWLLTLDDEGRGVVNDLANELEDSPPPPQRAAPPPPPGRRPGKRPLDLAKLARMAGPAGARLTRALQHAEFLRSAGEHGPEAVMEAWAKIKEANRPAPQTSPLDEMRAIRKTFEQMAEALEGSPDMASLFAPLGKKAVDK